MMAAAMQPQQQQQQQHPPGGSILDVAREKDEGALRALCQVCSASGEVGEARKACVLVTIYRRESDLFALLLRERHDAPSSSSAAAAAAGRSGGKAASAGLTVLCDMSLDDGVHLEMQSAPLVVKVVNTCGQRIAYLLEFGRAMDLATFQRAFTSARGYFRQMLTLRTLVADSFWQGFASGAEAPVRTEPHGPPDEALKPPPGVVPGQPEAGLRGKSEGPGALGLDSETLAAQIVDLCASGEGGSATGSGAASSRVRSPGGGKLSSSSRGGRAGGGSGNKGTAAAAAAAVTNWPGAPVPAGAAGAAQRKANKEYNNRFLVMDKSMSCHRCHRSRPGHHFVCPNNTHVNCVLCLTKNFPVQWEELQHGIKRYYCPQCQWGCSCSRCDNKQSRGGSNEHNGGAKGARADTTSPLNQYLPAPQLTHYEGLFAKYLQSLPALERVSTTEDVCFLCKEGGNLVECDEGTSWSRRVKLKLESLGKPPPAPGTAFSCCGVSMEQPSNSSDAKGKVAEEGATGGASKAAAKPPRCKKVYHAYCMGFNVGDDELSSCPRHACVDCGEAAGFFCRFCPVSLCDKHFRTDPSGMIAETYESLKHRVRRPFPRTRGGGFGPRSSTQAGGTGTVAGASSSSSGGGGAGSRGGRGKRGRPGRGRRGRGGGRWSVRGAGGEATIAQRRPKRGQTATVAAPTPAPAVVSVSGGGGGGDRRSCGVGLPGGGAGFGEHDFVCTGCKMAAKRAVRQYGLLGSLETGGMVLPYGESEGSGDESESDILPVTALPPRDSGAAASGTGDGSGDAGGGQEHLVSAPAGAGLAGEPEGGHNIGGGAVGGGAVVAGAAAVVSNAAVAAAVAANNAAAAVAAEKYFSMFSRRDPPATPEVAGNGGDAGGGSAGGGGGGGGGNGDGDVEMG